MDLQTLAQLEAQSLAYLHCPHGASSKAYCAICIAEHYMPGYRALLEAHTPNATSEAPNDEVPGRA